MQKDRAVPSGRYDLVDAALFSVDCGKLRLVGLIKPSLTGRGRFLTVPGSELPGYYHLIPPGYLVHSDVKTIYT